MASSTEIRETSSVLRKKAEDLRGLSNQFKGQVDNLVGDEGNLANTWDGPAKDTFHREFEKDVRQMRNFKEAIDKYAAALDEIAQRYDQQEQANVNIGETRRY